MKKQRIALALLSGMLLVPAAQAQLSQNPNKFLGNITTYGQVNPDGIEFSSLWNQLTPENESKWSSIEGSRNNFNWWGCDNCYNYCRDNDLYFKFHTLVWGSQYPSWMDNLNSTSQYKEIIEWYDAIAARYPDLDMIDVVNEAIAGHAPAPFREALGGEGSSGYDWIVKAFELAHERWPNAILIYNDYNTFQWNTDQFIALVKAVRDAGAPIDAYGCQSHDLTDCSLSTFKNSMTKIQNALKMPMYSSEYDIGTSDDNKQLNQYRDQIKYMWEQSYVAGITLWGYIYGKTWVTDGNSGIIRNGEDRPAMTWLRGYMGSAPAKTTESPYPNCRKPISFYIRPEHKFATIDEPFNNIIDITEHSVTIDHVDFYINNQKVATLNEAPYVVEYTPTGKGHYNTMAVAYDTDGKRYDRLGGFNVVGPRSPYHGEPYQLPGAVIQAEDFDICGEGVSYHDSDTNNQGTSSYRNDSQGVDIITGGTGHAIGYTAEGEWLEYTVDINDVGKFNYEVYASSGASNGGKIKFTLYNIETGAKKEIGEVTIPNTGGWDTYAKFTGLCDNRMTKGSYYLRMTVTGGSINADYFKFTKHTGIDDVEAVEAGIYDVYTTTGIYMGEVTLESDNAFAGAIRDLTHQKGVYLIRNKATNASQMVEVR